MTVEQHVKAALAEQQFQIILLLAERDTAQAKIAELEQQLAAKNGTNPLSDAEPERQNHG